MVISNRLKSLSVFLLAINVTFIANSATAFSFECRQILSHTNEWSNPTADRIIRDTKKPWEKHTRDMSNNDSKQWYVLSHTLNFKGLGTADLEVLIIDKDVQVKVTNLNISQSRWSQVAGALLFTQSSTERLIQRLKERLTRAKTALRKYYPSIHKRFTVHEVQSQNQDAMNADLTGTEFTAAFDTRSSLGMDSLTHFISLVQNLTRDAVTPDAAEWHLPSRENWSDDILYYPPLSLSNNPEERTHGAVYIENIEEVIPYGLTGTTKNFLAENAENISIRHLHFQTDKMLVEINLVINEKDEKLYFELTKDGVYVPRLNGWNLNPLFGLIKDNNNSGVEYILQEVEEDPLIVNAPLTGQIFIDNRELDNFIFFIRSLN